jgi:hypothetical protein
MRPLRRPTRSTIHYHGRAKEGDEHTVTLSINGVRYEYHVTSQVGDTVEYLAKHVSAAKALVHAKMHCLRGGFRLDPAPVMTTLLRNRGGIASRAKRMKVTLPDV